MNQYNFYQKMLENAVAEGVAPSLVAAVGRGGQVLFEGAAGDANLDTRFDMASMTKILAPTMLALRALEEGMLTLWDSVARFFPDAPPDKANITIFQLMTHTAGFTPAFWLEDVCNGPEEAARCILRSPLEAYPPDGVARYSCMGYILLGKILETAYGAPLDALAQEHVFAPLGMRDTSYCPQGENIAPTETNAATGQAWQGVVHDENARFLRGVSGNAGVFSNIRDCERFAAMLAAWGGGYLCEATLRRAIYNYTPGQEVHRGLGFHLGGTPLSFMGDLFPANSFGHTGFTGTSLVVDPHTGLYTVILSNRVYPTRANEKIFRFRRLFHNKVYATETRNKKDT